MELDHSMSLGYINSVLHIYVYFELNRFQEAESVFIPKCRADIKPIYCVLFKCHFAPFLSFLKHSYSLITGWSYRLRKLYCFSKQKNVQKSKSFTSVAFGAKVIGSM